MKNFGSNASLISNIPGLEVNSAKSFFCNLNNNKKKYLTGEYIEAGYLTGEYFILFSPSNFRLDICPVDSIIQVFNKNFCIKKSSAAYFKENILYTWAILQEVKEELPE